MFFFLVKLFLERTLPPLKSIEKSPNVFHDPSCSKAFSLYMVLTSSSGLLKVPPSGFLVRR
ncbi:Predicted protein [Prochlorococcus marinus subsp. marinus str. CCMP1375]|uniref:Uncharacterized protein n=1 Tax=Prochlorococcus marinus (strain SARG / CCMP1375 / SS120) TaxID=167539 RepID=Q7VDA9_PROMA|nr:Predicted protein [Prochlorococcus marinus subsp. marinus str. CCMP1375]